MSRKGFSVIEVLIVTAIMAVIATAGFLLITSRQASTDLEATAKQAVSALRTAQQNALTAASSTAWGVRFDNTTSTAPRFVIFASSSYAQSAETMVYPVSKRVIYDTASVPVGGTKDVVFGLRTGTTASTTVVFRATNTSKTYVISISSLGLVTAVLGEAGSSTSTAPMVSGINPTTGSNLAPLTGVVISGSNFVASSTVKLTRNGQSDIAGSGFTNSGGTSLTGGSFNLTGAATGAWTVVVTNPDTQAGVCTGCLTVYEPGPTPTFTGIAPTSSAQGASSVNVTLTGTNFVSGASSAVSGTGVTVNNTTYNSSTSLTMNITVSGGAATGTRDVTVTNPDAQQATCTACLTVTTGPPAPTGLSPSSRGQGALSYNIEVNGSRFVSGATVSISGTGLVVGTPTFVNSSQLLVGVTVSSTAATGTRDVTVTNPDAQQGVCTNCFTINTKPTVTTAAPTSTLQGTSSINVAISGTGFDSGASSAFSLGGVTVNNTTYNSTVQVTANLTVSAYAITGAGYFTVTNGDGGVNSCVGCFTIIALPPTVASSTPNSLAQGTSNQNLTITGDYFDTFAEVTFSGTGITVNDTTYNSATSLTANVTVSSGATLGARDVIVTNGDAQQGTCAGCFTVTAGGTQYNTGYLTGSGTPTLANSGAWTAPTTSTDPWYEDGPDSFGSPVLAGTIRASATSGSPVTSVLFKGFSFGIGSGTVDKICLHLDNVSIAASGAGTQRWTAALTWDGGTSFTSTNAAMPDVTGSTTGGIERYFADESSVPGTSDPGVACTTWGRTWSVSELSSANFGVLISITNSDATSRQLRFDRARVKIYYTQ